MNIAEIASEYEYKNIVYGKGVHGNKDVHTEHVLMQHIEGNLYKGKELLDENGIGTEKCEIYTVYGDVGLRMAIVPLNAPVELVTENEYFKRSEKSEDFVLDIKSRMQVHMPIADEQLLVAGIVEPELREVYNMYSEEYNMWTESIWEYISKYNSEEMIEYLDDEFPVDIGEYVYKVRQIIRSSKGGVIENSRAFMPIFPGNTLKGFSVNIIDFMFFYSGIDVPKKVRKWGIKNVISVVVNDNRCVALNHFGGKKCNEAIEYMRYFQEMMDEFTVDLRILKDMVNFVDDSDVEDNKEDKNKIDKKNLSDNNKDNEGNKDGESNG